MVWPGYIRAYWVGEFCQVHQAWERYQHDLRWSDITWCIIEWSSLARVTLCCHRNADWQNLALVYSIIRAYWVCEIWPVRCSWSFVVRVIYYCDSKAGWCHLESQIVHDWNLPVSTINYKSLLSLQNLASRIYYDRLASGSFSSTRHCQQVSAFIRPYGLCELCPVQCSVIIWHQAAWDWQELDQNR